MQVHIQSYISSCKNWAKCASGTSSNFTKKISKEGIMKNTSGNDNCVEELCSVKFKEIVHFHFYFFLNSEHSVTHTA